MAASPRDFLAVATPGAGKTTFALALATELIARGIVDKLTVVCPTEHLKGQWASSAARFGIHIDPDFTNSQGVAGSHFDGVAITYAQVGSNPAVHAARTRAYRTLVILDEIHHAGDALSWGDGVREAFTDATRRLALTGTPFRSDTSPIPFVTYEEDAEGIRRSRADYTYGYGDALKDGVVRPVLFMSYSGQMAWRTNAGDEVSARLGEPLTKDMMKQAWRTALDPKLQKMMNELEGDSACKTGMTLNIAINYGGRPEIVRAAQQLAAKAAAGEIRPEDINEQMMSDAMYTAGQKDPDFILRPSGEKRLSNFMLWQAAYSELVEMDVLWPDFTRDDLDAAITEFNKRSRRFGGI